MAFVVALRSPAFLFAHLCFHPFPRSLPNKFPTCQSLSQSASQGIELAKIHIMFCTKAPLILMPSVSGLLVSLQFFYFRRHVDEYVGVGTMYEEFCIIFNITEVVINDPVYKTTQTVDINCTLSLATES